MKSKKVLWVAIFVFTLSLSIFFYWIAGKNDRLTDLENAYLYQPVKQNDEQRQWREVDFKFHANNTDIMSSYWIANGKNETFYIADNDDLTVKKFDREGNLIQRFGQGDGRGPGEILRFDGMYVDEEERIWITDESNGRITILYQDGTWEIYHPDEVPRRAVPLQGDNYVMDQRLDTQLRINELTNNQINRYSDPFLVDEGVLWAFIFDSTLEKDPNGGFIRSFYWTNDFIKYSEIGEMIYFRRPVHPIQLSDLPIHPPRQYEPDQDVWFNEINPSSQLQRTADVSVLNNRIHLLIIEFREEERFQDFVDVYESDSGDYLYSYRLPQSLQAFTVTENYLAGILRETEELAIWKLPGSF